MVAQHKIWPRTSAKRCISVREETSTKCMMTASMNSIRILVLVLLTALLSSCASPMGTTSQAVPQPATVMSNPGVPSARPTSTISTPEFTGTPTVTNSAVLTAIASTPRPTRLHTALSNETGIIPGESTEKDVEGHLGKPRVNRGTVWSYNTPLVPGLAEVRFSRGLVQEIMLWTYSEPASSTIIDQLGPPELVAYFPRPERPVSSVPVTEPPPGPPSGELVYASRGVLFHFFCNEAGLQTCPGVSRKAPIYYKVYFVPMTVQDWVTQQSLPTGSFYIRQWAGFSD